MTGRTITIAGCDRRTTRTFCVCLILASLIGLGNILLTSSISSAGSSPTKIVDPVPHWVGGDGPSAVFDQQDTWHMVYGWIDGSGASFINHRTSKGTNETIVVGGSAEVMCPGLAIDSKDKLYVFYRSTKGSVYLINNSAGAWSPPQKLVEPGNPWSGSPSAIFDKDGAWHLVYGWINSSTSYITHLSSSGVKENIFVGEEGSGSSPHLAIDPSGKLYVSFRGTHGAILGTSNIYGNWSVPLQLVDPVPHLAMGDSPSSVFDKEGKGHMVYGWINDSGSYFITYIKSSGIKKNLIEGATEPACNPEIAVNSNDDMLVFYRSTKGSIYSMVLDKIPNIPPTVVQTSPPDHSLVGATDVNLTWSGKDQDGDILGYYLFFDDVGGYTLVGYQNTTTYHATGLKDGTRYYWTVIPNDGKVNGTSLSGIMSFTVRAQQGTPIIALWIDIGQPEIMLTLGDSKEIDIQVNCIGADIKSVHLQSALEGKLHLQVEQLTASQDIKAGVPVTFKTRISLKGGGYRSDETGHVGITALGDGIDSPTRSVLVSYDRKNSTIPPGPDVRPIVAAVGIGVTVLTVSLLAGTEIGLLGVAHLFMPLYSKPKKHEKRDQVTRGKIQDYIMANPGDHYSLIKKGLDLKHGPLTYNLDVLEREGRIVCSRDGIFKRFYPKDAPTVNKNEYTYTQYSIIDHIRKEPGITQVLLAKRMKTSKQVIDYHVNSLMLADIITLKKEGKMTHCFLKDQKGQGS